MLSNNIFFFSLHIFSGWGWARSGKGKWSQLELSGDFEDFQLSEFGLSCGVLRYIIFVREIIIMDSFVCPNKELIQYI